MCGTFEYGLNAAAKEFDGKNKYIRITDIDDASREFLLSDLSSPDICLDGMSKYLLSSGDIVFARTGASVGKTYIYRENDGIVYFAGFLIRAKVNQDNDAEFVFQSTLSPSYEKYIRITSQRSGQPGVNAQEYGEYDLFAPSKEEQQRIGHFLRGIDSLITLHQRKPYLHIQRRCNMLNEAQRTDKFCEYYAKWITVYKKGAIRQVTMDKYLMTQKWLEKLIPDLKICDLNRIAYQQLLNDYAEYHERQTTMDFHHQLKGAVLDAVDEGLIDRDPTRKAIIKGKAPSTKKIKYLNQFELHSLLCRWFTAAVLPLDEALEAALMRRGSRKRCAVCGAFFFPKSNRGKYCPDCAGRMKRINAAKRKRKQREKCHALGHFKPA